LSIAFLIGGKIRRKGGSLPSPQFSGNMSSSPFLTGCCEKNLIKGEVALASGEEANNKEKVRDVYCRQDY